MRNTFSATVNFSNADQLASFIDAIGHLVDSINIVTARQERVVAPPPVRSAPPKLRGSKINTTILNALAGGPKTVKEMKEALEGAGMSAGSLSTGLATLQKAREVERIGDGLYGLVGMKAAAE